MLSSDHDGNTAAITYTLSTSWVLVGKNTCGKNSCLPSETALVTRSGVATAGWKWVKEIKFECLKYILYMHPKLQAHMNSSQATVVWCVCLYWLY